MEFVGYRVPVRPLSGFVMINTPSTGLGSDGQGEHEIVAGRADLLGGCYTSLSSNSMDDRTATRGPGSRIHLKPQGPRAV
jgi:hypothetical protein